MRKVKILYIVHNMACKSGVSSIIMNYYRNIDKTKIQIDFLLFKKYDSSYEEELLKNGSNVYYVDAKHKLFNYFKVKNKINSFFKNNKYDIIELHSPTLAYLVMKNAQKNNISIRIVHTHSTTMSSNKIKNLVNHILNYNLIEYSNVYFSCSKASAEYWYNSKTINSEKYYLITNGIDVEKYKYNESIAKNLKKELKLSKNKTVGFVGRISKDKNLIFLSKIIKKIIKKDKNIKFIFVGDGNELSLIQKKLKNYKSNVIFLGMRNNVNELLNAFDLLVLPSKKEGLPMVLVEAQANGLKCIASNTITNEVNVGNVKFIPLNQKKWESSILNTEFNYKRKNPELYKFDINICAKRLEQIYIELIKKRDKNGI